MAARRLPHARARLRPGRAACLLTGALVVVLAAALPAPAQVPAQAEDAAAPDPPTTTTLAPGTPGIPDADAYRELATQVLRNEREVADVTDRIAAVDTRLAAVTAELTDAISRLEATRAELARFRALVKSRAAFIYSHAHAPAAAVVDIERVTDLASGRKYAESATRSDVDKIQDLEALEAQLDQRRRDLEATRTELEGERQRLQRSKDDLDTLLAKQRHLLDEAGAITVMGDPQLTGEEMGAWFNARGVRPRLSGEITITDLATLYVEEGAAEHVRPELAFVQAVLETGSFGNATDNNYAGIGACDSCTGQIPFATPRDGVRGQIQMLRNYADPTSRAADLVNPPSAPIYGSDPARAAAAYDTFFAKGRVPTWNMMGNGNWATDPGYSPKVLTLYFQLMSFATRGT